MRHPRASCAYLCSESQCRCGTVLRFLQLRRSRSGRTARHPLLSRRRGAFVAAPAPVAVPVNRAHCALSRTRPGPLRVRSLSSKYCDVLAPESWQQTWQHLACDLNFNLKLKLAVCVRPLPVPVAQWGAGRGLKSR